MWDCSHCGCKAIAASVEYCPMCFFDKDYLSRFEPAPEPADTSVAGELAVAEKPAEPEEPVKAEESK